LGTFPIPHFRARQLGQVQVELNRSAVVPASPALAVGRVNFAR